MVSFPAAISLGFRNYVNFSGFATRAEYWWWTLFNFLVGLIAGFVDGALFGTQSDQTGPLSLIVSLGLFLPSLAVAIRRLRDAGHHWANIFWVFLPIIGWIILIVFYCQPTQHLARETYGYTGRY